MMRVLLIGGVDPSGGAGIAADTRTLHAFDTVALPVVAALTVQNRFGFHSLEAVRTPLLLASLRAAADDGPVHAIKVGLLANAEQIDAIAAWFAALRARPPLVVDPVLSATAGGYAAASGIATAYRQRLVPVATVFTPNLPEAEAVFAGKPIEAMRASGCGAVLLKGGHGSGDELVDRLVHAGGELRFSHPRRAVGAVHGTGCALASAIAALLARGRTTGAACGDAIDWLQRCLGALPPPERKDAPPRPVPILAGPSPRR